LKNPILLAGYNLLIIR